MNKTTIHKQRLIAYIILTLITLSVYGQVHHFEFVNYDDPAYITENIPVQSGMTRHGFNWAFSTKYFGLWNPLVWLSFMLDYEFYGLNAGGYHVTNLILHILSTLLLFWLFARMTRQLWPSAFVAAFFALHPLHVESVAWVSERKDVLSAFFWMLTLCLYVYYTEKPALKRYVLVLFSFVLALMSKPMVVTLPLIMILLDYWPLKRFELNKNKIIPWQLKEKLPFLILSLLLVIIAFYTPGSSAAYELFPLKARLANAPVAFVAYLIKTFWPHNMAVFYPFPAHISVWQAVQDCLLIIAVSMVVLIWAKKMPCLLVGWFWFFLTIVPVLGIHQIGDFAMTDRYHYLPSIGVSVILAWSVPMLFPTNHLRKKVLLSAALTLLALMTLLTWKQCGYWKDNITLFRHALNVTKNNYLAHNNLGLALFARGNTEAALAHYNEVIRIRPADITPYHNKAIVYTRLGQYSLAIENYNEAIRMMPDNVESYHRRADVYQHLGLYQRAIDDLTKVIALRPDHSSGYYARGNLSIHLARYQQAIDDYSKAISLNPDYFEAYNNRAFIYLQKGQYRQAYDDYSKAISIKPDYADAYNNRAFILLSTGNMMAGCKDGKKACALGNCSTLQLAIGKGLCH